MVLSAAGLGDEAFGLCRTAVEIELAIRCSTNKDTESRCRRFSDYAARNYVDLERKYCIHISREGTSSPATFKEMEAVAKEFKNQHRWWPDGDKEGGVKLFAAELSTTELDDQGKPSTEEFRYDIIYRMMSYFTHGTIGSLMANHRPKPEETFWVAKGAVSSRHEGNALRTAALSALLSLKRVLSYFNYELPDLLLGRELHFQPDESA